VIPAASITAWARNAPWPTPDQIEQDLLLSRLICEIAAHPNLGDELVFRGGTCLHKLHLPQSLRYSEDLDYVRAWPPRSERSTNDAREETSSTSGSH
jgi:predicted nucleotidyltransferase component of viral defense system